LNLISFLMNNPSSTIKFIHSRDNLPKGYVGISLSGCWDDLYEVRVVLTKFKWLCKCVLRLVFYLSCCNQSWYLFLYLKELSILIPPKFLLRKENHDLTLNPLVSVHLNLWGVYGSLKSISQTFPLGRNKFDVGWKFTWMQNLVEQEWLTIYYYYY